MDCLDCYCSSLKMSDPGPQKINTTPRIINPVWVLGHFPIVLKTRGPDESLQMAMVAIQKAAGNPDLFYFSLFRESMCNV